ncbi:RNA polymerase sigma-70 factor (ECF subfamily) [Silvibacterium bohemicum]|uniref:RNA polymerase sigma-70 factor (ECF subfamily) n=1 Tax=Silvibacterium bohemicum TaxID=1577686 RepID=A0A841JSX1_9BACT|nr:sigma-70 family RNA polymerase sigma factor [Silvibacterium bohemicum]MBB6144416.1 RNA polymerase sigma-70 factor (ECF subfamily) [Silvibacterium bohemicum]
MASSSDSRASHVIITKVEPPNDGQGDFEYVSRADRERALIQRVGLGDPAAFELLIGPYRKRLQSTISRIVRNSHDAEDVAQQCLLQVFTKLDQFRGHSQFSTWMTRIAINESLGHLRKKRVVLLSIDIAPGADDQVFLMNIPDTNLTPEESYSAVEVAECIKLQIDGLPCAMKSAFELLYMEDLTMEQTAGILGITTAAAKSRALRARRHLRERLDRSLLKEGPRQKYC